MDEAGFAAALARLREPGGRRLEVLTGAGATAGSVGLVPGSFDPITRAHVALAEALLRRGARPALFVYSVRTLPKDVPSTPLLRPEKRLAAVAAACRGAEGVEVAVCSHGLLADQARAAADAFPGTRPVIAVGSDKLRQLFEPRWYRDRDAALARLFSLAEVVYAVRTGARPEVEAVLAANPRWASRMGRLDLPPDVAGLSSTVIRERVRAGLDVADLVPPAVVPFLPEPPRGPARG